MLEDTRSRLVRWGNWVRSGGMGMGYTTVRLGPSLGHDVPDGEALQVDGAVARLKLREPGLGKVLIRYYVSDWNHQQIGEELGISRDKIRGLLRSGEAWVDGVLSIQADAYHERKVC